ncbi:hypothetical protein ACWA6H_03475 [Pseudomonas bijieensis]|jgi:hypothetical protein|uniref:hypothetical protein n=1 Tax=Pseudomonas sp. 43mfcvi1.1 TaxID=1761894 RepID=UPI000D7B16B2|nr:hypothetical protein [Pseudomonas sp. 43mfcvi1.1]PWJ40684.1 hypothetical protein ATJ40_102462 [Pseudomonas sp. 43mfcvi1.1]SSB95349.1 hypothetical protein SAMN04488697_102462 [Pseudomonas sp. 43mfcvi1.1]
MNDMGGRSTDGQLLRHSGTPAAAVVGGSIVSFDEGLSFQDREDIYLSNLYAQLATRSAYKDGLVGNWFDYYKNKLRYLGWDSARPVSAGRAGQGLMVDSVSRQISRSFDERFSRQASQALGTLRRNPDALEVFERTSLLRDTGCFQVIPCTSKSSGRIEIGLYHKQFRTRRTVSRFLFWPIEDVVESSQEEMAVITFSTLHYATFREKVAAAVMSETVRHLHALEL